MIALAVYGLGQTDGQTAPQIPASASQPPRTKSYPLIRAAKPIAPGAAITAGDIAASTVDALPPPGVVSRSEEALGKVVATNIAAGQPIHAAMLRTVSTLAPRIPPGHRAISLQTTEEIAVSGLIQPGDMIDVQLVLRGETVSAPGQRAGGDQSESRTLLENVPVLAVGPAMTASNDPQTSITQGARTITLALLPRQLSEFTLARSIGSLYLALRNPAETGRANEGRAVLRDIRGHGGTVPVMFRKAIVSSPRQRPIQLVVGGESTTVYAGGRP